MTNRTKASTRGRNVHNICKIDISVCMPLASLHLHCYTGGGSSGAGFGVRNARMLCWPSICLSGRRLEPALAGFLLGGVGLLLVPGVG